MINNQWNKCKFCNRDQKYVMFDGPKGKERLVCKSDCVQPISRMEVYNALYISHKNELKCGYKITEDKASRKANIYAVKNTDLFFNQQHYLLQLR